jgi:hypothetical protein
MDPSTDINQDPLTMNDNGATSFASDFDMSAINEAVAAGGEANQIQNSFDVNDIDLDNTPTSDAQLQSQLNENPNMSLAGGADLAAAPAEKPKVPEATFVDGDLSDEAPAPVETPAEEPVAEEPIDTTPNFNVNNFDSANINATPVEDDEPEEAPAESEVPAEPEEPATIADLANAATSDPVEPETAAEETPAEQSETESTAPAATEAPAEQKQKTKMPTYLLIGLAIVAVVAVIIAVVVSLG